MKILPDYEHMEYRDVYTCRTYLTPCARAAAVAAWAIVLKLASQPWEVPSPAFLPLTWGAAKGLLGLVSPYFQCV